MSGVDMSLPSEMTCAHEHDAVLDHDVPAVLPTISMASRMGTPDERRVPMVAREAPRHRLAQDVA